MDWFDCHFPCVAPTTPVVQALGLMGSTTSQDYVVVTEYGRITDRFLGIVTLCQLLPLLANPESADKHTLASLMDSSPIALNQLPALQSIITKPNWCAVQLQNFMAEQQISHLPILNQNGVAIAVITHKNLSERMAQHITKNECETERQEISTRENYLLTLSRIQSMLLEAGSYRDKLQEFINLLGQSSNASRAYIFAYHRDDSGQVLASQLVQWCAEGITPQIDNPELQNLPMETCAPNILSAHCQGQPFCVLVREFSGIEREILAKQDIRSILFLPIMVQGECWGGVGFDDCLQDRVWQEWEIAYLQTAVNSLASSIQREQAEVFYESLFDHSTDAIFLVDSIDFTIIDVNQRAVELFEADSVQGLIDAHSELLHCLPKPNEPSFDQNQWYCEVEYRTLKGKSFWGAVAGKKVTIAGVNYFLLRIADISNSKRSEQLLKEQKEFLESIYEGSGKAIFIIDVTSEGEFIFRDANPTFERLTSLKRSYIANKQPAEVLPPDIAESAIANYRRCITECRTITYEEYAPLHTGASWWVTTLTPLYDAEDRPYRIIGTSIEISDRKKAEQALKDSELLLKETEAISKVGGWFIDLKNKRAECTDELKRILGIPKDLLKFSPLQNPEFYLSFLDSRHRRRLQYGYSQLVKKGIELDLELPLTAIDGTPKWVRISARPIRDPETQEIIKISGSLSDITDKKQMELDIKASENRFRNLIENLNVGMVVFDPTGKIQLFNSKALELLGLSADQLQSRTAFDPQWRTINPDGTALYPEQYPVAIAIRTLKPVRNVVMGVYRQENDLVWLLVHADPQFYPQADNQKELFSVVVCFTDITEEYARIPEKIFSESRYRQIIQTQHEYVLVSLPDTRIIFANNSLCQALGMTLEELKGRTWSDVVPPEELSILQEKISQLSPQNPTFESTNVNLLADGKTGWTQWLNQGFFDEMGNLTEIQSIGRDITALKLLQAELENTAKYYRSLIENSDDLTLVLTRDGYVSYVSPSCFHIVGCIPPEMEGHQILEFIHPDYHELMQETIARALSAPFTTLPTIELLAMGKDGQWRWFEGTVTNLLEDMAVQGIVINCRDISDRIKAETALRDREAKLQSIFKNIAVVVYSYAPDDSGGKFVYLSENASQLFGISAQQIQEDANLLWNLVDADYLPALKTSVAQAQSNLAPWRGEFSIHLPSGNSRWIRGESECVLHPNGTYTWDGVLIDITVSKQIEISLRESEQRLLQIFNNIPVALYRVTLDREHNYWLSYVSANFWDLMGIPAQPLPLPLEQVISAIHPHDRQHVLEVVEQSTRTLSRCYKEFRVSNKWLVSDGIPMLRTNGEIVWDGVLQDITRQKELVDTLEELNTHLALVVESSQVGFYLTDLTTGKSYVSPAYKAQLGYPPDSPHGVPREWRDRLHPEDRERSIQAFRAFLDQTAPNYNIEFRLRHRDGSYRWILSSAKLITDELGKPIKVVGSHVDITERKQMEEQLRQSELRFRQIFEYSPLGMLLVSADHRITAVNQTLCEMLDFSPEELLGREVWQIIHREDVNTIHLRCARISSSPDQGGYTVNVRMVTKGEGILWTKYSVVLLRNTSGQVVNQIIAVEDTTVFREAQAVIENTNARLEALVKERTDALEASQAILRQQLEKNELLLKITERIRSTTKLDDLLSRTVHELREVLSVDRVLIYRLLENGELGGIVVAEAISSGATTLIGNSYAQEVFPKECWAEFAKGKVSTVYDYQQSDMRSCLKDFMASINVSACITAGIGQANSLWGIIIVHSQTPRQWQGWEVELVQQLCTALAVAIVQSELYQQLENELEIRRKAEQELQLANAQLVRANRLKDEFLANMSHELRTPLNSILGLTEGLLQEVYGRLNSKQMQYLQTIERSGKHLLDLINDILDLAKIESGTTTLNLSEINIHQLCESCLQLVRPQAMRKGIQLRAEIAPNLETVVADERQLRQLLLNLLSNAVKFTNSGGAVLLKASQQGSMLSLAVSDTGIGIAEKDMPKLFLPFSQVDSNLTRRYSGTGLGLALVKRIAELHGGTVSVTSELGKGSCFTVLIPFLQGEKSSGTAETAKEHQDSDSLPLQQRNRLILLVEDNEDNIETLRDYLEAHGYRVMVVCNGQQAVQAIIDHMPDLVLMDAQMPEMDGFSATARIRAMPQFADLPIIILTALSMDSDRQKAMSAGATAYIAKPFSLRSLVQKIDKLLNIEQGR